jgi:hypothetical protein
LEAEVTARLTAGNATAAFLPALLFTGAACVHCRLDGVSTALHLATSSVLFAFSRQGTALGEWDSGGEEGQDRYLVAARSALDSNQAAEELTDDLIDLVTGHYGIRSICDYGTLVTAGHRPITPRFVLLPFNRLSVLDDARGQAVTLLNLYA